MFKFVVVFMLLLGRCGALNVLNRRDFGPLLASAVQSRGQRAVGTPNSDGLDIDAKLGIAWGGAKRCDAAEADCSTNGGIYQGEIATVPNIAKTEFDEKAVRLTALIANKESITLHIGLFPGVEAGQVFAQLADRSFVMGPELTPAGLTYGGVEFCLRPSIVSFAATPTAQELAFRRKYELRTTPDDFIASQPRSGDFVSNKSTINPANNDMLPAGLLVVSRSGPGPRLEFSFLAQPAAANKYIPVGSLLDQESMRSLARLAAIPVVADRAALGGKACKPIVKLLFSNAETYSL